MSRLFFSLPVLKCSQPTRTGQCSREVWFLGEGREKRLIISFIFHTIVFQVDWPQFRESQEQTKTAFKWRHWSPLWGLQEGNLCVARCVSLFPSHLQQAVVRQIMPEEKQKRGGGGAPGSRPLLSLPPNGPKSISCVRSAVISKWLHSSLVSVSAGSSFSLVHPIFLKYKKGVNILLSLWGRTGHLQSTPKQKLGFPL